MRWFQVEKARHVLLLREKLLEQNRTHELTKLDKHALNEYRRHAHVTLLSDKERERSSTEMEKSTDDVHSDAVVDPSTALVVKCLKLMLNNGTERRARLLSAVSSLTRRHVFQFNAIQFSSMAGS